MVTRDLISLDIDQLQMGIGGEDSWGAQPLLKHQIKPNNFHYEFTLFPLSQNSDPINIVKKEIQHKIQ